MLTICLTSCAVDAEETQLDWGGLERLVDKKIITFLSRAIL